MASVISPARGTKGCDVQLPSSPTTRALPGPHHAPVADHGRAEHTVATGDETAGELGGYHGGPVLVAEDELVEAWEQDDTLGRDAKGAEQLRRPGVHEVLHAFDLHASEGGLGQRQSGSGVRRDQVRPAHEILDGGRAVAGEVAPGQLPERLVALQAPLMDDPLIDEDDQLLAVTHRPEAHQSRLGQVPEHVVPALVGGGQAACLPCRQQLGA